MPRFWVATPHVTGKSSPRGNGVLERAASSSPAHLLVLEVALHQRLVGLDDRVHELLALRRPPGSRRSSGMSTGSPSRPRPGRQIGAHDGGGRRSPRARAPGRSGSRRRRSGRRAGSESARAQAENPARSRSSMFTKRTRASRGSRSAPRARPVCTSTPVTPLTTMSAPSRRGGLRACRPGSRRRPGVSIRLIFAPATRGGRARRKATSAGGARPRPSPRRWRPARRHRAGWWRPAWKSIASTSEVFPVPRWPTTATLRMLLGSNSGHGGRV